MLLLSKVANVNSAFFYEDAKSFTHLSLKSTNDFAEAISNSRTMRAKWEDSVARSYDVEVGDAPLNMSDIKCLKKYCASKMQDFAKEQLNVGRFPWKAWQREEVNLEGIPADTPKIHVSIMDLQQLQVLAGALGGKFKFYFEGGKTSCGERIESNDLPILVEKLGINCN